MQEVSEKTKKLRSGYLEHFDPKKHNELFYSEMWEQDADFLQFSYEVTKELYKANCKQGGKLNLLDFGCASNPMHVAAAVASDVPLEVVMSEFLSQNRKHLRKWINGEEFQVFEQQFDVISRFSGKSIVEIKKKTRDSISKVESYDLFHDLTRDYGIYDIIISSYTVECASTCQEEYEEHMKKLVGLLRKGGTLLMTGTFGARSYSNGEAVLEMFPLSEKILCKLIPQLGLQFLRFKIHAREECISKLGDYEENFTFIAKKML